MGAPAKVKRPLTDEEVLGLNLFWQNYVEYSRRYRAEVLSSEFQVPS
jgi:carbonic anhydrase/acetyltransferase-like protein (isoleucine patch superfamily)